MYRWRRKILFTLIVYFAGFATAIYALAPVDDDQIHSQASAAKIHNHSDSGSNSQQFASTFNTHMRKYLSVAEEQAEKLGEFIKAKLAERRTNDG